jgi:hypothetical protein
MSSIIWEHQQTVLEKKILSLENWFARKPDLNRCISRKDPDIRIQLSRLHMANYVLIQKGFLSW